ncbi:MAG: hypothetical protein GX558_06835 [Clostridiales bacterium]|nr:hypothetical protein [Clostridiales bacterium]
MSGYGTSPGAGDLGGAGCLLLSGFSGGPEEMWPLAGALERRGALVRAPLIFPEWPWYAWLDAARVAYSQLANETGCAWVVGVSLGALLALRIAEEYPVDRLALVSPPRSPRDIRAALAAEGVGRYPDAGLRKLHRVVQRDLFAVTADALIGGAPGERGLRPLVSGMASARVELAPLPRDADALAGELCARFIEGDAS